MAAIRNRLREASKTLAFGVLGNGPLLRRRLDRIRKSGVTTILNLHRVGPDDGSSYRPLPESLFEELLTFIAKEFSIVTFNQLCEKSPKPKLILSFDDGYKDFATHAVPTLKRHGIRVNQNIIPGCVESGLPPVNVLAQDFIGTAPAELIARLRVPGYTGPRDARFPQRLSSYLKMRPQAEQDALGDELLPQFQDWDGFRATPMMSIDDIREIAETHELGAHSYSHSSMEFETDEFLARDVKRCAEYFAEKLRHPMTIYAFPNGSCREGQQKQVLNAGVRHVLLVGEKFDHGSRVHQRFTFDAYSPSHVRVKATGGAAQP